MKKFAAALALALCAALALPLLAAALSSPQSPPAKTEQRKSAEAGPGEVLTWRDILEQSQKIHEDTIRHSQNLLTGIGTMAGIVVVGFTLISFFGIRNLTSSLQSRLESISRRDEEIQARYREIHDRHEEIVRCYDDIKARNDEIVARYKEAEGNSNFIRDLRRSFEKQMEDDRLGSVQAIDAEPNDEIRRRLDETNRKLRLYEDLGFSLRPEDYMNRGVAAHFKGDFKEALDNFDKAIALKPSFWEAWSNKGVALNKLGRHEEALRAYGKAIALNPDYYRAWYNKALCFVDLGRYEDAVAAYEKTIAIKPDFFDAWRNKAIALEKLGRPEDALRSTQKARELNPLDSDSCINEACSYALMQNKAGVLESLADAIALDPSKKEKARTDPDFDWLRDDPEFRKIVD